MNQYSPNLSDKSTQKEEINKIISWLVREEGFTLSQIKRVIKLKKYIPVMRLPERRDLLIDFRGCK